MLRGIKALWWYTIIYYMSSCYSIVAYIILIDTVIYPVEIICSNCMSIYIYIYIYIRVNM